MGMLERFAWKADTRKDAALETEIARCLSWLGDPAGPEHLKKLGARSLGRLAWPLRSPGETADSRKTRAGLLGRAVTALEHALREDLSSLVRADAVNALVRLEQEDAADVLVEVVAAEPPLPVRRAILGHLVRFGDERALDPLVGLTRSERATTRRWAVRQLGKLGDGRGRAAIVESRGKDSFWHRPLYWRASWRIRRGS